MKNIEAITYFWSAQQSVQRFKAPKGKVYAIRGWHCSNGAVTSGFFILQDQYIEEEFDVQSIESSIYSLDLHTDGLSSVVMFGHEDAMRTKYMSFGPNVTASVVFTIYYTVEDADLSELIWEYIGKKR